MKGFYGSAMKDLQLRGRHPQGGLTLMTNVVIHNPSNMSIVLPFLAIDVHLMNGTIAHPMIVGEMSRSNVTLVPGNNSLVLDGRIPTPKNSEERSLLSSFISSYLRGEEIPIMCVGSPRAQDYLPTWLYKTMLNVSIPLMIKRNQQFSHVMDTLSKGNDFIRKVQKLELDMNFLNSSDKRTGYSIPIPNGDLIIQVVSPFPETTVSFKSISVDSQLFFFHENSTRMHVGRFLLSKIPAYSRQLKNETGIIVVRVDQWNPDSHVYLDASETESTRAHLETFFNLALDKSRMKILMKGTVNASVVIDGFGDNEIELNSLPIKFTHILSGLGSIRTNPVLRPAISQFDVINVSPDGHGLLLSAHVQFFNPSSIALRLPTIEFTVRDADENDIGFVKTISDEGGMFLTRGENVLSVKGEIRETIAGSRLSKILSNYVAGLYFLFLLTYSSREHNKFKFESNR